MLVVQTETILHFSSGNAINLWVCIRICCTNNFTNVIICDLMTHNPTYWSILNLFNDTCPTTGYLGSLERVGSMILDFIYILGFDHDLSRRYRITCLIYLGVLKEVPRWKKLMWHPLRNVCWLLPSKITFICCTHIARGVRLQKRSYYPAQHVIRWVNNCFAAPLHKPVRPEPSQNHSYGKKTYRKLRWIIFT